MSGLDKILSKLSSDCASECRAVTDEARHEADSLIAAAEADGKARGDKIIGDAERDAEEIIRLVQSAKEMKARQNVLLAKVETLNSVLSDALKSLTSMNSEQYYAVIGRLAAKNAIAGDGIIIMSKADADNMPQGFIENINKLIGEKGTLTLQTSADFDKKGIMLIYGDIEINLTFEAMLAADEDACKDIARKIIFG